MCAVWPVKPQWLFYHFVSIPDRDKGHSCLFILTIWHMGDPTEPLHPSQVQGLKLPF